MKIMVTGSREWIDRQGIENVFRSVYSDEPVEFIHGAAPGADRIAAYVALQLGWDVTPYPADWNTHGKKAGFIRNWAMVDQEPDLVLAFPTICICDRYEGDHLSHGTWQAMEAASSKGIPVLHFFESVVH